MDLEIVSKGPTAVFNLAQFLVLAIVFVYR